jgi:dienelactone hydrolase
MQFTSQLVSDGVMERTFKLDINGESVPGVIWTPADTSECRPIILMGHGGSQHKKFVGVVSRAQRYVKEFGFTVVAIDAPGHGERPPSTQAKQFVIELKNKMAEGQPIEEIVTNENARLALQLVPEGRATLDAVQSLDDIGREGAVGYLGFAMGGAIGISFIAAEPRISAAVLGLIGLPPNHPDLANAAAQVTIPVEFVLQWNDELVPRESGLALFDAFGSQEKTLHANPGGHARPPAWESESWERFFNRHLEAKI